MECISARLDTLTLYISIKTRRPISRCLVNLQYKAINILIPVIVLKIVAIQS